MAHLPSDEVRFKEKMLDTEQLWQFSRSWASIDGCHAEMSSWRFGSLQKVWQIQKFYSIIFMGMVDAKYRFIWASCEYPGNSYDSTIFK